MRADRRFQDILGAKKNLTSCCFFLIALYFFFGSTHILNIFISLTTENSAGLYFEFINISTDRTVVFVLASLAMIYISTYLARKLACRALSFLLLSVVVWAVYFLFIPIADALLILVGFAALTWFLTSSKPFREVSRRKAISNIAIYLAIILLAIELLSLFCWFIFPLFPELSQEGTFRHLVDLETKMFLLTGGFAPLLAVFFLFSWIAKPFSWCNPLKRFFRALNQSGGLDNLYVGKLSPYLLYLTIALSFLVAVYPYLPGLNADAHAIGVDTLDYKGFLSGMNNGDLPTIFLRTFFKYPDRPLGLYTMYLAKQVGGFSALSVVQFFPSLLAPALVLAVYFFVRQATGQGYTSSLAAFLAFSSFHVSVGMYGGFLSNWMAIIESYLFMGFFFSFLKKKSHWKIFAMLLFSVSMLFTHAYAWGMTMGILLVYLIFTIITHLHTKHKTQGHSLEIRLLLAIISVNAVAIILRNYALGGSMGRLEALRTAEGAFVTNAPTLFLSDTYYVFFNTMYRFFINPPVLLLAAFGGCLLVLGTKPLNRYLTSWLIASSIFFVFTSGWEVKSRILFSIPLPVYATVGLIGVCNIIPRLFEPDQAQSAKNLTTILILLVSLNYVFRCAFAMSQLEF